MTAARKSRRARRSAPPPPAPTDNQLFEAMLAFATLKMRYRLEKQPWAPIGMQFAVRVIPENILSIEQPIDSTTAFSVHHFRFEADARLWREQQIIRETIKVAMRTKP